METEEETGSMIKAMGNRKMFLALLAGMFVLMAMASPAKADLIGTSVTGSLQFGATGTPNYFDPANGFVPAGFLNTAGPTVVISPTSTEFGFSDGANIDTADFTGTALTVTDNVLAGATNWIMTFTDTAFTGLNLVQGTDTFTNGGVTGALSGDKITLDWAGTFATGLMTTTFTLNPGTTTATPEPSSFLMLGVGLLGLVAIGRSKFVLNSLA
jgi:PEP-CTERM motif